MEQRNFEKKEEVLSFCLDKKRKKPQKNIAKKSFLTGSIIHKILN